MSPFFSYWNVTFPCSNVNFESLVLQYVHHISLGRPIKLTTHVMELHCYASFDLSIGLLDRKVCNKKKELPNLCAVSKLSKCIILFLVICLKCLIQVCRIVFIVFHYQHSKLHYLCVRESFTAYKVCLIWVVALFISNIDDILVNNSLLTKNLSTDDSVGENGMQGSHFLNMDFIRNFQERDTASNRLTETVLLTTIMNYKCQSWVWCS